MGAMQEGDILVLLSKSGNTQEVLNYLPAAGKKGLTVIGVTENEESRLGLAAEDFPLSVYPDPSDTRCRKN